MLHVYVSDVSFVPRLSCLAKTTFVQFGVLKCGET